MDISVPIAVPSLTEHVAESIAAAERGESQLTQGVLSLGGMSSAKVRHFLNNVCCRVGTNYLEVGTYAGSTFVSALFRNQLFIRSAFGIDDYSQFGGWETFQTVTTDFLMPGSFEFIRQDFRGVTLPLNEKINVYFYDGGHSLDDHIAAVTHFWDSLADEFVVIVDDWLESQVQSGTHFAFGFMNGRFKIVQQWELPSRGNGDTEQWWNGLFVAVVRKIKSAPASVEEIEKAA